MNINEYKIRPSEHFALTWMRKWDFDITDLRKTIENANKIEKVGKNKYEVFARDKGKGKKIIFVKYDEHKEIFVITGAEGT